MQAVSEMNEFFIQGKTYKPDPHPPRRLVTPLLFANLTIGLLNQIKQIMLGYQTVGIYTIA